jgi:cell division transport system permease protein
MGMKITKLQRTFKEGLNNFYRNGWLSFATVSILAISLYIISVTVILGLAASIVSKDVQNKINVSVYFNSDVQESKIQEIKNKLIGYKEIKSIEFASKDQALDQLKKTIPNKDIIPKALEIMGGENPLLAALVINAKSTDQYNIIVKAINGASFASDISYIDYNEEANKVAIERFTTIARLVQQVGLTLGIVFVFIGILITFNAIRLTMYAHKQEFEIMRLVGASNIYIRMPFIFEGIFYGVASAFGVMIALFVTFKFLVQTTSSSISEVTAVNFYFAHLFMDFYLSHFFIILPALLVSGVALGTISAAIAIRRYLKI